MLTDTSKLWILKFSLVKSAVGETDMVWGYFLGENGHYCMYSCRQVNCSIKYVMLVGGNYKLYFLG